jgi:hypothetical protein
LGTASINDETGAEIGDDTVDASVVANVVVGAPTTGGGKMLEGTALLDNNQSMKRPVTHFVLLSELESLSIDDGVGARDK